MQFIKTKEQLLSLDTELLMRALKEFPTEEYDFQIFYRIIITGTKGGFFHLFWFTVDQYGESTETSMDYDWIMSLIMVYKQELS